MVLNQSIIGSDEVILINYFLTGPGKERHTYAYSSSTGELISDIITNEQGSSTYGTYYTYGPYNGTNGERMLQKITMHGSRVKVLYDYDDFYRSAKTVLFNNNYTLNTSYTWRAGSGSNRTSYMPSGQTEVLKDPDGNTLTTVTLNYTYDVLGNIETIKEGSTQRQKYYYDSVNQLIREDNLDLNQTIVYSYDLGGNLTSTAVYPYQTGVTVTGTATTTNTYTYGDSNWKDKLTAYNGNTITYDAIGNPTSYYNGYTFTWQKGRQLASAVSSTNTVSYTYNNDGYRTSKTVNGTLVQYTLEGSQVRFEKNGSLYLWYYYDASGAPVAFSMQGTPVLYFYRKNLQGDVTGVYKGSTGDLLVSYVYDAWGKVTATDEAGTTESANVLTYNPYLYRGYRYDAETGLYYLNSRYYDPETGRFINADTFASTGKSILSANVYAYSENNPTNMHDKSGKHPLALLDWSDRAIIHLMVQIKVSKEKNWAREVFVKGIKGRGFLDLLDAEKNQYYEIKSKDDAKRKRTTRQMEKYDVAIIQNTTANKLITPKVTIGSSISRGEEYVKGSFQYGIYDVEYSSNMNGLITYTTSVNWERALTIASVEVLTVLVVLFPEGAPALAPVLLP